MRGLLGRLPGQAGRQVAEAAKRSATLLRALPPRLAAAAAPLRRLPPQVRRWIAAAGGRWSKLAAGPRRRAAGLLGFVSRPLA